MKLAPFIFTLIVLGIAYVIDLPKTLGAHPWWSRDVILIGGGIGLIAGFFMARTRPVIGACLLGALTVLAFIASGIGKEQFAASYADDKLAGQIWFMGWQATLFGFSGFTFVLATLISGRIQQNRA